MGGGEEDKQRWEEGGIYTFRELIILYRDGQLYYESALCVQVTCLQWK